MQGWVQEHGEAAPASPSPLSPALLPSSIPVCLSLPPSGYRHLCRSGAELGCERGLSNGSAGATLTQHSANVRLLINSGD